MDDNKDGKRPRETARPTIWHHLSLSLSRICTHTHTHTDSHTQAIKVTAAPGREEEELEAESQSLDALKEVQPVDRDSATDQVVLAVAVTEEGASVAAATEAVAAVAAATETVVAVAAATADTTQTRGARPIPRAIIPREILALKEAQQVDGDSDGDSDTTQTQGARPQAFPRETLAEFANISMRDLLHYPTHYTKLQLLYPAGGLRDGQSLHPARLKWNGPLHPVSNTTAFLEKGKYYTNETSCARDAFNMAVGKVRHSNAIRAVLEMP